MISRDSQSTLEGQIESSRVSDEREVENHRADLAMKCSEIADFGSAMIDEIRSPDLGLGKHFNDDQRREGPLAQTMSRAHSDHQPRKLGHGPQDEERAKGFRRQRSLTPDEGISTDDDEPLVVSHGTQSKPACN